jgi:hypothetical protein
MCYIKVGGIEMTFVVTAWQRTEYKQDYFSPPNVLCVIDLKMA